MKKILIIDNDFDTMSLIKRWLDKKSYTVRISSSQEDVKTLLDTFAPELVIVDTIHRVVVERIKAYEHAKSIRILMMTGYTRKAQTLNTPVDDTIEKPFNLRQFESKVAKLIHDANA